MTKFVKNIAAIMVGVLCTGTVAVSAAPADNRTEIEKNTIHTENITMEISTEEANLAVATTEDFAMVHKDADADSEMVGKLYEGNLVNVIEEVDEDWSLIESGNLTGYVSTEALVTGDEEAVCNAEVAIATAEVDSLDVLAEASEDAEIIEQVDAQTSMEVVSQDENGWVEVVLENPAETSGSESADRPETGYLNAELVTISTQFTYGETLEEEEKRLAEEEEQAREEQGQAVIDYAVQFVGNPYVYGGSSLTKGTDCSGFVMSVYRHFGVDLPHSSKSLRSVGTAVSQNEMRAGDIVCYSGHVALYMGDGRIVHASNRKTGIIISENIHYKNVVAVRRIF